MDDRVASGNWEEHTRYKEQKNTRMRIPGVLKMKKGLLPMQGEVRNIKMCTNSEFWSGE